jgi:hypothetical protein
MKINSILILAWVVLGLFGCRDPAAPSQNQDSKAVATEKATVLESLPEPDQNAIRQIRTAEDWHNPYVMVCPDGYELILRGRPRTAERLSLREFEKTLLTLPLERWPLGRVIAIQENALRSKGDDERIEENLDALKRMLELHKIRTDLWPTA